MSESHAFPVTVQWKAGKQGTAWAPGLPALEVSTPPEFGGPEGRWSPEHLYAAAVASCLMATFVAMAGRSGLSFAGFDVGATATVERGEGRRMQVSRVLLRPRVTLFREEDRDRAGRILDKAHAGCLVSNSIRSEVTVEPRVEVDRAPADTVAGAFAG